MLHVNNLHNYLLCMISRLRDNKATLRVGLECAFGSLVRICILDEMRYHVWQLLHLHFLSIDRVTF